MTVEVGCPCHPPHTQPATQPHLQVARHCQRAEAQLIACQAQRGQHSGGQRGCRRLVALQQLALGQGRGRGWEWVF